MQTTTLRSRVSLCFLLLVCVGKLSAQTSEVTLNAAMLDSVQAFLASLSSTQRDTASYDFDADERLNWHFIPRPRNGLSYNDMEPGQRALADRLLATFLGDRGYRKVEQIRSLEAVLRELETNGRFVRDPMAYYFTVFGQPSTEGTWAFRLEGHHIALNWTFVAGRGIASTPQFFGSNPAEVRSGDLSGLRVLATEEDLGRQLVRSLTADQRSRAVLAQPVPRDILTAAEVQVTPLDQTGIPWGDLDSAQRLILMNLIEEVAATQPDAITDQRMGLVRADRDRIQFTWVGGTGATDAHYWRIQGSDFLIEYDKVQNDANHIHLVWRDFDGDFGNDLIRLHYQAVAAAYGPGHRH